MSPDKLIVKVDSQILNSMDLCWERYNLEHIGHWRPLKKAKALERGSSMHTMVRYYRLGKKNGRTSMDQHAALVQECLQAGKIAAANSYHLSVEDFEEDVRVFKEYVLRWQYDGWEILDVEEPFSKILYEDDEPIEYVGETYPGLIIIYEGVIDARIRDPRIGVAVVDTKTESRRSYPYILSNQFQGYEWAWGCPVIVDKVGFQTSLKAIDETPDDQGRDKSKFRRLLHDSGQFALDEWRSDAITKVKEAINWHRQLATGARVSLPKNRTSCDKYSGCIFQMVCKVPVEVREYKLSAYFYKGEPWDPYTRDDDVEEDTAVGE